MKLRHTGTDTLMGKAVHSPVIISDIGRRTASETFFRITNHINYGSKDLTLLVALRVNATATLDYSADPESGFLYMFDPSVVVVAPSTTGFIDWYRVTQADRAAGYTYELLEGTRDTSDTPGSGNLRAVEGPTFHQELEDPEGVIARDVALPRLYAPDATVILGHPPYLNRLAAANPAFVPLVYNLWKPNNIGQQRYIAEGEVVEFVETGDFLLSAMQGQIRGLLDRGILEIV